MQQLVGNTKGDVDYLIEQRENMYTKFFVIAKMSVCTIIAKSSCGKTEPHNISQFNYKIATSS